MSNSQNTNSYIKSVEENAAIQMEFETDQKEEASEAVLFLLKEQASTVIQLPNLSNRDMLTTSLVANRDLPRKVKQQVSMFSMNLQHIIWEVALRVESHRYEPVTQGVSNLDLTSYQKNKAATLVNADKDINISIQAVNTSIQFFSRVNKQILKEVEESRIQGNTASEFKLILANSILVYELANFTVEFLEKFQVRGIEEISHIHEETIRLVEENRRDIERLKKEAMTFDGDFRNQSIAALNERTESLNLIKEAWNNYLKDVQKISDNIESAKTLLPKLRFIRDDAKNRIDFIDIITITRIVGNSIEAVSSLITTLETIELVPLPPETVSRLIGVQK